MGYHFIPTRTAIINRTISSTGKDLEKLEPPCTAGWEGKMGQPLWKTVIVGQALKRLNIKSQYDPATPPKRCEKLSHKHLYTTVGSITHNSQQVKTTNGCMVKQKWCIYTMECNSTIKRNKVRQTD